MKKLLVLMLLGLMATGCGKEEAASGGDKPIEATVQEALPTVTKTPDESMPTPMEEETEDADTEEDDVEADGDGNTEDGEEEEAVLENEYFRASLKSFEIDKETDMVSVVFEFENITDQTYYKNDEEIRPGAGWEKVVTYSTEQWQKGVGTKSWIHYDLYEIYDKDQEPFFSGGLCFSVAEDLTVTDMELFTE